MFPVMTIHMLIQAAWLEMQFCPYQWSVVQSTGTYRLEGWRLERVFTDVLITIDCYKF